MIPGSFEFHRPASLSDAISLMSSLGDDALVLAGGHSLIPMMKLRMAVPEHIVDLQDIESLKAMSIDGGTVTIGAMVTQHDLIGSKELHAVSPIIREAALQIADPQVRYVGTIGGNVANGDPGNDMPAVMMALDASFLLSGPNGEREVRARDYYEGPFTTAREDNEILTGVLFAAPSSGHGSAYEKQKRKIGDYATAAAAVILDMSGKTCSSASIALTNLSETPLLAEQAASILAGKKLDDATIAAAADAAKAITDPAGDGRGPADYRTHLAGIVVARAITTARDRAA